MIINVTPTVRIRFSEGCWTLEKQVVVGGGGDAPKRGRKPDAKNVGAVRWDALGYHGNIETAALSLLMRHLALLVEGGTDATGDVKWLVQEIRKACDKIAKACEAARQPVVEEEA